MRRRRRKIERPQSDQRLREHSERRGWDARFLERLGLVLSAARRMRRVTGRTQRRFFRSNLPSGLVRGSRFRCFISFTTRRSDSRAPQDSVGLRARYVVPTCGIITYIRAGRAL